MTAEARARRRSDWIAQQAILLELNQSNIDGAVRNINSNPGWVDGNRVARLVTSVAGSRKNCRDLIEFMTKLSETRGYSAVLGAISAIEELVRDPQLDAGMVHVRLRAAIAGLQASVEAAVSGATSGRPGTATAARCRGVADDRRALQVAAEQVGAVFRSIERDVAAATTASASDLDAAVVRVIERVLAPLRSALDRARSAIRAAVLRPYGALHAAEETRGSAFEVFALHWKVLTNEKMSSKTACHCHRRHLGILRPFREL
jgi:hypothetical protein